MGFFRTAVSATAIVAMSGCTYADVQGKMSAYLEQKYERKFVVGEPKLQGNETMGYNTFYALANAVDEPDLKFPVYYDAKGNAMHESYLAQKWTEKGKEITKKEIEEIYGCEVYIWSYEFYYRASLEKRDFDKIKNLNHNELLGKYGKDCVRNVSVAIFLNRPYNREKEAEMIDKLYNKLFCNRKMEVFLLNVGIFDNKHNEEVKKYLDVNIDYGFMGKREWYNKGFNYMAINDLRMSKDSTDYNKNINDIKKSFTRFEGVANNVNR